MGKRYESKKQSVSENREAARQNAENRDTLEKEFASLGELSSMISDLDDEAIEAISAVENSYEQKQSELSEEHEQIEKEKTEIASEINQEIDKLNNGSQTLDQLGRFEFGKSSIDKANSEYKRLIEDYKGLLDDLDEGSDGSGSSGGGGELSGISSIVSDSALESNDGTADDQVKPSFTGFVINAIASPFNSDVRKWTSNLSSISAFLKNQYSTKYGRFISAEKLNTPLSETLVYETQSLFSARGLKVGVLGYNDGVKSRVAVGTGHELQTTVHENLHQLSANGYARGIIERGTGDDRNVQLNEAITEMLTQRTLGDAYGQDYSLYSDNRDAMKLIESVMGEDTISEAYFQNKPELMRDKIDSALGPGTWDQLSEAFDDSVADNAWTRESGRIRRDDIINRYLMTATQQSGGDHNWMNLL